MGLFHTNMGGIKLNLNYTDPHIPISSMNACYHCTHINWLIFFVLANRCPPAPFLEHAYLSRVDNLLTYTCTEGYRFADGAPEIHINCNEAIDVIGRLPYLCLGECLSNFLKLQFNPFTLLCKWKDIVAVLHSNSHHQVLC